MGDSKGVDAQSTAPGAAPTKLKAALRHEAKAHGIAIKRELQVVVLRTDDGKYIKAFNQGEYVSSPMPLPPGTTRNIQSSGCGLCALTSYIHAAGLKPGGKDCTPATFNEYLTKWCNQHPNTIRKVYRESAGALEHESAELSRAINDLAKISGTPGYSEQKVKHKGGWKPGEEIEGLAQHLDSGKPAIIGVKHLNAKKQSRGHQVLVVGYGRIGDQIYYLINDSGAQPNAASDWMTGNQPSDRKTLDKYCAGPNRPKPTMRYLSIEYCYLLSGLEEKTKLKAANYSAK